MSARFHRLTLEFTDPELEDRWQDEAGERLQRALNWGTVVVSIVLVLSVARDLVLRWEGWQALMAFRLAVVAPLALSPWLLSRGPRGAKRRADIVLVSLAAMILSMAVMLIWMPVLPGTSKPLISVLFFPVFAAATTLFPIGFRRTLVLGCTGVAAFVLAYSQVDPSLLRISVMIWAVFALGGIMVGGSWRLERQERLTWLAKHRLEAEQASSLALLRNVFPAPIADRLLASEAPIADRYDELVVLFADVVGFTPMARSMPAARLVEHLDRLFTDFDTVVRTHGYTKVKTIGDAYMAVGGLPWEPADDRPLAGACLAWDLVRCAREAHGVQLRIGLHFGPGVAGVIGQERFIYDFWGDTVNVASRLESSGEPGRVQLSEAMSEQLEDQSVLSERGVQELKGVGPMRTFWLEERPDLSLSTHELIKEPGLQGG